MIALPLIGFSALKFGEAGMDVLKCANIELTLNHQLIDTYQIASPPRDCSIPWTAKTIEPTA